MFFLGSKIKKKNIIGFRVMCQNEKVVTWMDMLISH